MARHREHSNGWLWVLPSLAIPLVVAAVAWTTHVASEGDAIAPNVKFAGLDVSGLDPDTAAEHVAWRQTAFHQTPVTIDLGERSMTLSAEEIGFDYLYGDTVRAVVSARHKDTAWGEFMSWVRTPFESLTVDDRFVLHEDVARAKLAEDDFLLETPVEPSLNNTNGTITVVPGIDGVGVDIDGIVADLAASAIASGSVEVVARHVPVPPRVSDSQAEAMVRHLNEITSDGVAAAIGDRSAKLNPAQIRRHISSKIVDGQLRASVDVAGLQQELEWVFPGAQGGSKKPILDVVDGQVRVVAEGVAAPVCCSPESVKAMARQVLNGGAPIYRLETRPEDDPDILAWAKGTQVTEMVSQFTTHHACCENRVTNIQTMADRMRGYYMLPGETLSFNEYVGPRTREKGYVAAGAIRGGYMTDEVGGGVSQFVTTMFNAAFYGGLDLDEYQSHSVYFSRYPYGREATLSIPGPDLVLTNNTDYPVLIWPTYDSTSITVSLYSTAHVEVAELDQRISSFGQCRHSEIDRQRTYPDGRVVVDTIEANYRPAEGIDCNGNVIPKKD